MTEVTEITDFRAALVHKVYQAQLKCPGCDAWIITDNLEVWRGGKDDNYRMFAEATNVICKSQVVPLCGHELGTVRFVGWQHSAPVKWREHPKAESEGKSVAG